MKPEDLETCIKKLSSAIAELGGISVPLLSSSRPFSGLKGVVEVHNFLVDLKEQQVKDFFGGDMPSALQPANHELEITGELGL